MSTWRDSVGRFRYKHSPLVEALCEFGFAAQAEWNPVLLSALDEAFQSDYPERKSLKTIQAEFAVNPTGVQQGIQHGERIQYASPDGTRMVHVAPNALTINNLRPYSGWDAFKPQIFQAFESFREISKPNAIFRAHLRYLNQIELQGPQVELDDWFEFSFRQPAVTGLSGAANYLVGARYPFDQHAMLKVEVSSVPSIENFLASVLDLEYILIGDNVLKLDTVSTWLDLAHTRVEEAWLGSITEKLHLKYQPEAVV